MLKKVYMKNTGGIIIQQKDVQFVTNYTIKEYYHLMQSNRVWGIKPRVNGGLPIVTIT